MSAIERRCRLPSQMSPIREQGGDLVTTRASAGLCDRPRKAASISRVLLAVKTSTCLPIAEAVACKSLVKASVLRLFGLSSTAKRTALGSSSCNSPSRLVPSSAFMEVMPVALPPGRLRLATRPISTGSAPMPKTIGTVVVTVLAASVAGVLAGVAITATPQLHQIAHQLRQPSVIVVRETEFDRHIAALDKACFVQAFAERRHDTCTQLRHTGGGQIQPQASRAAA